MSLLQFPPARSHSENVDDLHVVKQQPDTPAAREALGRVIDSHRAFLYAICLGLTSDPGKAEEVAQKTAIHAFKKIQDLRNPYAFSAWLRRIARSQSISFERSRHKSVEVTDDFLEQMVSSKEEPCERLIKEERALALHKGLKRLSKLDRQTLKAFYLHGLSLQEMSQEFLAPVGTIKRRLHVARRRLKEVLSDNVLFADEAAQNGEVVHTV